MEQLPNHLFDLIGQKNFAMLSVEEQTEILQLMDETEYSALHNAALIGHSISGNTALPSSIDSANKEILMQRFRKKHQKTSIIDTPVALWKVAATLLIFGLAFYFISMRSSVRPLDHLAMADTIYIEKEIPANTIFDTVYITEQKTLQSDRSSDENTITHHPTETPIALELPSDNNALNHLSIDEYRQLEKNKKRRNIKDDSLIQSIGFVHL